MPEQIIRRGRGRGVSLTFDDGPNPATTRRILDILDRYGVKGTFFVTGKNAERFPELVKEIHRRGHELATHGYEHTQDYEKRADVEDQWIRGADVIERITGERPTFARAPGEHHQSNVVEAAVRRGLTVASHTANTADYRSTSSHVIKSARKGLIDGGIILMHDYPESTIEALPAILDEMRSRGLSGARLSEVAAIPVAPRKDYQPVDVNPKKYAPGSIGPSLPRVAANVATPGATLGAGSSAGVAPTKALIAPQKDYQPVSINPTKYAPGGVGPFRPLPTTPVVPTPEPVVSSVSEQVPPWERYSAPQSSPEKPPWERYPAPGVNPTKYAPGAIGPNLPGQQIPPIAKAALGMRDAPPITFEQAEALNRRTGNLTPAQKVMANRKVATPMELADLANEMTAGLTKGIAPAIRATTGPMGWFNPSGPEVAAGFVAGTATLPAHVFADAAVFTDPKSTAEQVARAGGNLAAALIPIPGVGPALRVGGKLTKGVITKVAGLLKKSPGETQAILKRLQGQDIPVPGQKPGWATEQLSQKQPLSETGKPPVSGNETGAAKGSTATPKTPEPAATAGPSTKEPWEMPVREWVAKTVTPPSTQEQTVAKRLGVSPLSMFERRRTAQVEHFYAVESALKEGKLVPDEVVDEFLANGGKLPESGIHPDLASKYRQSVPSQPTAGPSTTPPKWRKTADYSRTGTWEVEVDGVKRYVYWNKDTAWWIETTADNTPLPHGTDFRGGSKAEVVEYLRENPLPGKADHGYEVGDLIEYRTSKSAHGKVQYGDMDYAEITSIGPDGTAFAKVSPGAGSPPYSIGLDLTDPANKISLIRRGGKMVGYPEQSSVVTAESGLRPGALGEETGGNVLRSQGFDYTEIPREKRMGGFGAALRTPTDIKDPTTGRILIPGQLRLQGGELGGKASDVLVTAERYVDDAVFAGQKQIRTIGALLDKAYKEAGGGFRLGPIGKKSFEGFQKKFQDLIELPIGDPRRVASGALGEALKKHDELTEGWRRFIIEHRRSLNIETPDDWGITDTGYLPHIFLGDIRLIVDGALEGTYDTLAHAQKRAAELFAENPKAKISASARNSYKGDPAVRLGTKQFFKVFGDMADQIDVPRDVLLEAVAGKFGLKMTKQKWAGFAQQRMGYTGYSRDYSLIMQLHNQRVARWAGLSWMNRQIEPIAQKFKSEGRTDIAEYIDNLKRYMWGTPTEAEKRWGETISAMTRGKIGGALAARVLSDKLRSINAFLKLSHNPRAAIVNRLQPSTTLMPEIGFWRWMEAEVKSMLPSWRKKLKEANVLRGGMKLKEGEYTLGIAGERFTPFGWASAQNRAVGYTAGWNRAKKAGLDDVKAHEAGLEWADRTEFRMSMSGTPEVMRTPGNRLALQFKGFLFKNMEQIGAMSHIRKGETALDRNLRMGKWAAAQLGISGVKSAGIGLELVGAYQVYDLTRNMAKEMGLSEEQAGLAADVMMAGLPAAADIDISASVSLFDLPYGDSPFERLANWAVGPTVGGAFQLGRAGYSAVAAQKTDDVEDKERFMERASKDIQTVAPLLKMMNTWWENSAFTYNQPLSIGLSKEPMTLDYWQRFIRNMGFTSRGETRYWEDLRDRTSWISVPVTKKRE